MYECRCAEFILLGTRVTRTKTFIEGSAKYAMTKNATAVASQENNSESPVATMDHSSVLTARNTGLHHMLETLPKTSLGTKNHEMCESQYLKKLIRKLKSM